MTTKFLRDAFATRLVANEVVYCVSSLINGLQRAASEFRSDQMETLGVDYDDLLTLAYRQPGADDYRESAADIDEPGTLEVVNEDGDWRYKWTPDSARDSGDPDEVEFGESDDGSETGAWRAGYDHVGADVPNGAEVYEHWIVSTFLAERLRAHGETVVSDVAGLTVWGRCTTGQAISMDSVIQRIAVETYGDPA